MRKCPTCGSPFSENDRVCGVCGTTLKMEPPEFWLPSFPAKTSTNLANGTIIGSGVTLLLAGLLIAFTLNGFYWAQTNFLAAQGINVNTFRIVGRDIVFMISFGALLALSGVYLLILGSLNQFSTSVRNAMNRKDDRTLFGTILIIGSVVFTDTTLQSVIYRLYSPNN